MAKGIDDTNLRTLMAHDKKYDDCLVRQFEMMTDDLFTSPGYALQFWTDIRLYGVREAILYVKNGNHGDWQKMQAAWDEVKDRIINPPKEPQILLLLMKQRASR